MMSQPKRPKAKDLLLKKYQFECIEMLIEAHRLSIADHKIFGGWDEDQITALFCFDYLEQLKLANQWHVEPEVPLFTQAIASGMVHARKAKKPDIKFSKYFPWQQKPIEFRIEAKNLSEMDWIKPTGSKVVASKYQKRYVDTGIDNFKSGQYPAGCLVGYVVQGDISNIATKLNSRLSNSGRNDEMLAHLKGVESCQQYQSNHTAPEQKIIHLMHIFLQIP